VLCDDGLNPWCLCLCCRRGNTSTGPPCSLRPSTTSSVLTSNSIRKYIASTSTTSYSQLQLRISRVFLYAYFYQYAMDTSLRYRSGKVVNPVRLESVCMDSRLILLCVWVKYIRNCCIRFAMHTCRSVRHRCTTGPI
jgi:hypothetical protein